MLTSKTFEMHVDNAALFAILQRPRGRPKLLKPSQEKVQIDSKSQEIRVKESNNKKQPVLEREYVTTTGDIDKHSTSVKEIGVEIKLEDVFHQMFNEKEATIKKNEISCVNKAAVEDISNSSKGTYRSKRLQIQQEKLQQSKEDAHKLAESSEIGESSGKKEDGNENTVERDSTDEESSSESSSETSESSSEEQEIQSEDDWTPESSKVCTDTGKTTPNRTRSASSPLKKATQEQSKPDAVKRISESSTDEESNKPLALIKEELQDSSRKVVTRVIKVVRKIKLKNGEIKRQVIKVIKKMKKVNNKNICPKVAGMRRTRCKKCSACLVEDDCGECVFCM